jgi:hypothetical protein
VGLTLALFLPIAFVDVDAVVLATRPLRIRRAVAGAGVLHNAVLALGSMALLYAMVPLRAPAPVITAVLDSSPLRDVIDVGVTCLHAVNGLPVTDADLNSVLRDLHQQPRGLCLSRNLLDAVSGSLCLLTLSDQHCFCIGARAQLPLSLPALCDAARPCPSNLICAQEEHSARILYVTLSSSEQIFIGEPRGLAQELDLSAYASHGLRIVQRLLDTFWSVNMSVALANAAPVHGFDGQQLLDSTVLSRSAGAVLALGTGVLALNVAASVVFKIALMTAGA